MKVVPFSPAIYNTSQHFWAKDMGQYVLLLGNRVHFALCTSMAMKILKKDKNLRKFRFLKYSGLVFGDGCFKTIFDLKVKILNIVLLFGGSKSFCRDLVSTPIAF
jgi:hypothetical protein